MSMDPTSRASSQWPSAKRNGPRSTSMRTISSAKSGLPSESRHDALPERFRHAALQETLHGRAVAAAGKGSRNTVRALVRPPPQPGRDSSSSPRARQSTIDGTLRPARQEIDEGEAAIVGPVDVLDDEDEGVGSGDGGQVAAPRFEEFLARVISRWVAGFLDGEHRVQGFRDGGCVSCRDGQLGEAPSPVLARRGRCVVVMHACVGLGDVGDGTEGSR